GRTEVCRTEVLRYDPCRAGVRVRGHRLSATCDTCAAPHGDQLCTLEDCRPDGCKRPRVPEVAEERVVRKVDVVPVVDEPIVELEHQPQRNRGDGEKSELTRR